MPERQRQLSHLLATTKDLKVSHLTAVHIQTCQGPEMKTLETVRHSGEGAIFSGGSTDSCLHACCRTEEIKFSIKPITRNKNSKSMIILQNKI